MRTEMSYPCKRFDKLNPWYMNQKFFDIEPNIRFEVKFDVS